MQKRLRKARQPKDLNQAAHAMMLRSTGQADSIPDMSRAQVTAFMRKMGRKGGKKGGKNRWAGVSAEERSKILSAAAKARWDKETTKDENGGREGI
jgi:hypothetical protein